MGEYRTEPPGGGGTSESGVGKATAQATPTTLTEGRDSNPQSGGILVSFQLGLSQLAPEACPLNSGGKLVLPVLCSLRDAPLEAVGEHAFLPSLLLPKSQSYKGNAPASPPRPNFFSSAPLCFHEAGGRGDHPFWKGNRPIR